MTTRKDAQFDLNYLDFQAYVGITKHNGGFAATNELLGLCHIQDVQEVLNVGCGIGVGSTYVARKYGCHVVGVDISEKMIEWSRRRAREERVEDKVEFQTAVEMNRIGSRENTSYGESQGGSLRRSQELTDGQVGH